METGPLPGSPGCPCPAQWGVRLADPSWVQGMPGTVQPLLALGRGEMQMSSYLGTAPRPSRRPPHPGPVSPHFCLQTGSHKGHCPGRAVPQACDPTSPTFGLKGGGEARSPLPHTGTSQAQRAPGNRDSRMDKAKTPGPLVYQDLWGLLSPS